MRTRKIGPPPHKPFVIPHIPGPPKAGGAAGAGHGGGTFDESKHPRDHGKFSHTEGASGSAAQDPHERATAALKDRDFLNQHRDRLLAAADTAGAAFPHSEAGKDTVHNARQEAIRNEAMRIHRETDGEVPDPAAAHAEHVATGERHRAADLHAQEVSRAAEAALQQAQEEAAAAADAKTLADADAEVKAGRLLPLPKEVAAAESASATVDAAMEEAKGKLDKSGAAAIAAVEHMNSLRSPSDDGESFEEVDPQDLRDEHEALTGTSFDDVHEESEKAEFDAFEAAGPSDPEFDESIADEMDGQEASFGPPDPDNYDDDEEGNAQLAADKAAYPARAKAYQERRDKVFAAIAERRQQHRDAAEAAHDALEAHLAELDKADTKLGKANGALDKARTKADPSELEFPGVNEKHFEQFDRDEDGDFTDEKVQEEHERLSELADERSTVVSTRLDEMSSADDMLESVASSRDHTEALIEQTSELIAKLDKLLKPKKPRGRAKKSANRPGCATAANVTGMTRYKLRLSKLDWISPVDVPAQETAGVLLIKRHGGPIKGFARVAKVDDSLGLVFCWAFTSKVAGADYHDLQGDAIDEDFVKAAAEFMLNGGGTDEMHDGKGSGRVVFAMPMTPEIAKAYGVTTTTTGLMVALKPPPAVLAKFKSGEYTGVSIAGLGTREVAKAGRAGSKKPKRMGARAYKSVVLTSEVDGHAHTIDLTAPENCWSGSLSTSYQNAEGADSGHSHAWIYDPATGAITIAADSGHTHTVDAIVPNEVRAAAAAKDDDGEQGAPCARARTDEDGDDDDDDGVKVVVVRASANGGVSTPGDGVSTVKGNSQENQIMDAKFAKMLTAALLLPEDQRAYAARLAPDEQQAFVGFDATTRESAMAAALALDPVVYTTKAGTAIRKSHGSLAELQAKQIDQQADLLAAQNIEISVNKARADQVEFEKRAATEIPLVGETVEQRVVLLKAAAAITDATLRDGVVRALKGAQAAFALLAKAQGYSPAGEGQSPQAAWESGLSDFAKAKSIENPLDAIVPFLKTEHGKALKKNLDALRPNAQPS